MPYREIISAAYDAGTEEEYARLADPFSGEPEYKLFIDLFNNYIPEGATVIDIGSGSGRYAEYLIKRDCKVGVVDLSARSLKAFSDRLSGSACKENVIFNRVSCATQLDWIESNLADAILLMGPLYHLIEEEHRVKSLDHCKRILKKGGLLISVFLSHVYDTNKDFLLIPGDSSNPYPSAVCDQGFITCTRFQGYDVPQFRCHPADARKLMEANGFHTIELINIEISEQPGKIRAKAGCCNKGEDGALENLKDASIAPQFIYAGSYNGDK
jgi:ubiquinone/menaquinone biosynthesis C-methylase UbiE